MVSSHCFRFLFFRGVFLRRFLFKQMFQHETRRGWSSTGCPPKEPVGIALLVRGTKNKQLGLDGHVSLVFVSPVAPMAPYLQVTEHGTCFFPEPCGCRVCLRRGFWGPSLNAENHHSAGTAQVQLTSASNCSTQTHWALKGEEFILPKHRKRNGAKPSLLFVRCWPSCLELLGNMASHHQHREEGFAQAVCIIRTATCSSLEAQDLKRHKIRSASRFSRPAFAQVTKWEKALFEQKEAKLILDKAR